MITKLCLSKQVVITPLLLIVFIFFCTKIVAQENIADTLNISILDKSQCVIDGEKIALIDLDEKLKNKSLPDNKQCAVLSSNGNIIIFQDIIDVLTALNKNNFKIKSAQAIVISGINFDYSGGPSIRVESIGELDKLIDFLNNNKNIKIEIRAHIDSRGRADMNIKLTIRRATSVAKYLTYRGIDNDRIMTKGYGEEQPLIKNAKTEEEHQINRRVEIKIMN